MGHMKSKLFRRATLGICAIASAFILMQLARVSFAQVPAPPVRPNPAPQVTPNPAPPVPANPAPPIQPNPAPPVTPNPAPPITPNPVPPIVPNPAVPIESPAPSPTITPLPLWLGVYCAVASQNFLSVLAWSFFPAYCLASRLNKNAPSTMNKTFGDQTNSSGCTRGFPRKVSPMMTKRKYVTATINPMAKPIDVSRRCAVTPSGTPMIANAIHANGNEK